MEEKDGTYVLKDVQKDMIYLIRGEWGNGWVEFGFEVESMGRYNRKHSGLSLIKYIEDEDKLAKIFKFEASVSFGFANSRYQGFLCYIST